MSVDLQFRNYLSLTTPLGKDTLLIDSLRGDEGISEPFRFRIAMTSGGADPDPKDMIGQHASVKIALHSGKERWIDGIVTRFSIAGATQGRLEYSMELRPWLWLLTLKSDFKIFQRLSTADIVQSVFDGLGFQDYRNDLTASYPAREYCVQYRESCFDFVSRLFEEDGVFYYFEHEEGKHTLVLADNSKSLLDTPDLDPLQVGEPRSGAVRLADNWLSSVRVERASTVGAQAVNDYNFETPASSLETSAKADQAQFEIYDFPGRFATASEGEAIAARRLQVSEALGTTLHAEGPCRGFIPGFRFEIGQTGSSQLDGSFVAKRVSHSADQAAGYTARIEGFPADANFRPELRTPRPRVPGCETAVVVGKSGEEIWTDEYGRVKVQFHWDRDGNKDENSSCWIRVDQGWAGKQWGALALPRIGQEVIVSFLNGDPDRPLVSGALYNADQIVPYTLPGEQTKTTVKTSSSKGGDGFNEIRFEDQKDQEELYIHAQKDMNVDVENSRAATIIQGDETLIVQAGERKIDVQKGGETHTVKGDVAHTDGANFTRDVTGDYTLTVKGNLTIDVTGSVTIKAGTTFDTQAQAAMTHKGQASQTIESSGVVTVKGSLVKIN